MEKEKNCKSDTDLTANDLKNLCSLLKAKVKKVLGKDFPDDHNELLRNGIYVVFAFWNVRRIVSGGEDKTLKVWGPTSP